MASSSAASRIPLRPSCRALTCAARQAQRQTTALCVPAAGAAARRQLATSASPSPSPSSSSSSQQQQPRPSPSPSRAAAALAAAVPQQQHTGKQAAEEKGHPKPIRPYSQLQRNVFALYRKAYRLIRTKPEDTQYHFLLYLRHAFKHPSQGGAVSKRDFSAIEHLLRKGERMVDQVFADRGVKDVHLPRAVIEEVLTEQMRWAKEQREAQQKQQQQQSGDAEDLPKR